MVTENALNPAAMKPLVSSNGHGWHVFGLYPAAIAPASVVPPKNHQIDGSMHPGYIEPKAGVVLNHPRRWFPSLSQPRPVGLTETSGVRREKRSEDWATALYSCLSCKPPTIPQEGCGINASNMLPSFGSVLLHVTSVLRHAGPDSCGCPHSRCARVLATA